MTLTIKKISWIVLSILLPIFCIYFIGSANSFIVNLNQYLIMFISLILMGYMPEKHFTLIKIAAVYFFFFFGVIPLNDLANANDYWGSKALTEEKMILPSLIIIIGLIFFIIGIFIGNIRRFKPLYSEGNGRLNTINYFNLFFFYLFHLLLFFM